MYSNPSCTPLCQCTDVNHSGLMASSLIACLHTGGIDHLIPLLSLEDCIRLACSSKAAHACLGVRLSTGAKHLARQLLVDRVKQAAQSDLNSKSQAHRSTVELKSALDQQVLWLVQQAGSMQQILPSRSDVDAFVNIDFVPLSAAVALTQHGFRFTYEQLVSAAQQQVRGPEVWMQAYGMLGVPRPCGMPAVAEALCCNDRWTWPSAVAADHTPEELLEVLQLAVAMPAVGTATNILEDICTSGAASGLDLKAVKQLAAAAIKAGQTPRLELVLKLPAALNIAVASLLHLLHSAISAKLTYGIHLLCKLPAAQLMDEKAVLDLLQHALSIQDPGAVRALCVLPVVGRLGSGVAQCLMRSVSGSGPQPCGMAWVLSQLPAAAAVAQLGAVGAF